MSWDQLEERRNIENGGHALRPMMMDVVKTQNADVLCFEEFFESGDTSIFKSNIDTITQMGFPFHYFVPVENENIRRITIRDHCIFSKNPIVDTASFNLNLDKKGEHLIYVDIKVKDKTFRVFATHLIPIKFAQWQNKGKEMKKYMEMPAVTVMEEFFPN